MKKLSLFFFQNSVSLTQQINVNSITTLSKKDTPILLPLSVSFILVIITRVIFLDTEIASNDCFAIYAKIVGTKRSRTSQGNVSECHLERLQTATNFSIQNVQRLFLLNPKCSSYIHTLGLASVRINTGANLRACCALRSTCPHLYAQGDTLSRLTGRRVFLSLRVRAVIGQVTLSLSRGSSCKAWWKALMTPTDRRPNICSRISSGMSRQDRDLAAFFRTRPTATTQPSSSTARCSSRRRRMRRGIPPCA